MLNFLARRILGGRLRAIEKHPALARKQDSAVVRKSQAAVQQLCRVAHSASCKRRYLAVLIAYFDESGSKDTPLVTMAGYLSEERRWKRFEREWARALKEYGAKYLHMKEYAHSRDEFEGWPEWKRKALMTKLIWTIKSNVQFRVGIVVPCGAYQQIVGSIDPNNTRLSPFCHCFQSCMRAISEYCQKRKITDDIALVFDENNESNKHATGFYTSVKQSNAPNRHQLVSLSFADDKKVTPLQAADLLAYEFNKYHRGYLRKPLEMLDGTYGAFCVWTAETLKQYASGFQWLRNATAAQAGRIGAGKHEPSNCLES